MEIWILIMHVLSGSGDLTHQVIGPFDEHGCYSMVEEIINLDARVSENHALVLQCRKATPAEVEVLNVERRKRESADT